jgi:tight adherence protein C
MALKVAGATAGGAAGLLAAGTAPGRLGIVLATAGPVAGFLAPDLWLSRRAAERFRSVRRELPALLDLLRVASDAGMTVRAALAAVSARARGVLAGEWRSVARELELGVPLVEALRELRRRLPLPEVEALAAALERADRHGSPLAPVLAAQAREARHARRRRIREEAARAGPKIQLVVALLLVPSVLLLVAAALAHALLDGGGGVGLEGG